MAARSEFEPSGFFALRTPLLPFEDYEEWAGSDGDAAATRERLRAAVARPDFASALFVASPALHERVDEWVRAPDSENGRKVERALVAYFSRATARATPFGLFAGCSVGRFGASTRLELAGREAYRRHSRLDMDYLWALVEALLGERELRRTLTFRPNSSLYELAERVRFVETDVSAGTRVHRLVELEDTPYLRATLERARDGAGFDALAGALADDEVELEEAEEYLHELIHAQVLVPDIHPELTGPEPVHALVPRLRRHAATAPAAECLQLVEQLLAETDAGEIGHAKDGYRSLPAGLAGMPAAPDQARLVQVDMVKPAPGLTLRHSVAQELLRAVDLLRRVAPRPAPGSLSRFREEFVERYGDREVALVEVLDEEDGIGFERASAPDVSVSPLLEGIRLPVRPAEGPPWSERDSRLLRDLTQALGKGEREIVLAADDLPRAEERDPLPDAFDVVARVVASSAEAMDRGDFQLVVSGASGPSGARLLGRFCHADEELRASVEEHLRAEEALNPELVFAEVVHQPGGRIGNILCRPVLRDREITFLGRSGAPADRQIPVSDLTVSVLDNRVVLRSRRLGREVAPRLTTAHNVASGLATYRFLYELQHQQVDRALRWSWGPLSGAPFLPRVRCGRIVLSRAMWNLSGSDLAPLDAGGHDAVQALRSGRGLPRRVVLADSDNELLIDLDNAVSTRALAGLLRRRERATLVEFLPGPEDLCVRGPEGRFVHELVVPFVRTAARTAARRVAPPSDHAPRRSYALGSEWLYAKLYAGPAATDRLLTDVVAPLVAAAEVADRWHFVRLSDPGWHLRLRFHGEPSALTGEVLPRVQEAARAAMGDGHLWRLQFDTYEPEVDRYGGPDGIGLAEELFSADSEAALAVLAAAEDGDGLALRAHAAAYATDRLLTGLGLDIAAKQAWARSIRDSYEREFAVDSEYRRQAGERFRQERSTLVALLGDAAADVLGSAVVEAYAHRSERLAPVFAELRRLADAGRLSRDIPDLAGSYVHMQANRLLRSAHRAQELVLAGLLFRAYTEQLERGRPAR